MDTTRSNDKNIAFRKVHALLSRKSPAAALSILLDDSTGTIRSPFLFNKNHAWYCVGDAQYRLEDYRAAVQAFRRALRSDANDDDALLALANCYSELGRPRLAERMLRRLLSKGVLEKELRVTATYNLGNALFDQKRFGEAQSLYYELKGRRDEVGKFSRSNYAATQKKLKRRTGIKVEAAKA